jgi:hypothetical protein
MAEGERDATGPGGDASASGATDGAEDDSTGDEGGGIEIGGLKDSDVAVTTDESDTVDKSADAAAAKTGGGAGAEGASGTDTGDDSTAEERSDTGDTDPDRGHIYLRRATSVTDFSALDDLDSMASRLARARGGETILDGELSEAVDADVAAEADDYDDLHYVAHREGRIKVESGFVMHFVDDGALDLHGFDIADTHQAYPVSMDTLQTLPDPVLGQLREQGELRLTAKYDREESAFKNVSVGWATTPSENMIDKLLDLANEDDGNIIGAAYFMAHEHGDRWTRPDQIAQIRDIEPSSVHQQIKQLRAKEDGDSS